MAEAASRRADLEQFPRLSYHYGLSFEELARMPFWVLRMYAEKLDGLIAETQMRALQAASFPYFEKASDRDRIMKRLERLAGVKEHVEKPKSNADLRSRMGMMGVPVEFVGKDGEAVTDA